MVAAIVGHETESDSSKEEEVVAAPVKVKRSPGQIRAERNAMNGTMDEPAVRKDKDLLKVYVGGLPFSAGKTQVREHFQSCGEIDWLHMPMDAKERTRGIAFISFWSQESVDTALQLNNTLFGKHTIKVNMATAKPVPGQPSNEAPIAPPAQDLPDEDKSQASSSKVRSKDRKVFIGNIPFSCTLETIKRDFTACGEIQSLVLPTGEGGFSKGIAFVTFKDLDGVAEALKFHETDYGGSTLTVRMASDKVEKGKLKGVDRMWINDEGKTKDEPNVLEVIVKGLGFGTKEEALRDWLLGCGEIDALRMPLNKKGKSYGFAFVTFQDAKGVKKAVKLTGSLLGERPCTVERMGAKAEDKGSNKRTTEAEVEAENADAPVKKSKRAKHADPEEE